MNRKRKALDAKLGSWADQANLSRELPQPPEAAQSAEVQSTVDAPLESNPTASIVPAARETYLVQRSLMTRMADVAAAHNMTQNELVGYLLTWSLDQIEDGKHQIER